MFAFHSNWTKPFFTRNGDAPYHIEDYDLLTTMLSALEWRKHNGSIKMVTDSTGADYYRHLGMEHIWDAGLDTLLENAVDNTISPLPFWAAGKIYALRKQETPCVMIDTDFIVWEPIDSQLKNAAVAVIHRENISREIYPDKSFFDMDESYRFPDDWDWTELPCNTAFLYIADSGLKNYYTDQSITFMKGLRNSRDITAEMVFAEQRMLAICAKEREIQIKSLLDVYALESQNSYTHVWGLKNEFKMNPKKREDFCVSCIKRIIKDFPNEMATLENIPLFDIYREQRMRKW